MGIAKYENTLPIPIGSLVSAGASLVGGLLGRGDDRRAQEQAMQGFNYLRNSPQLQQYINQGTGASTALYNNYLAPGGAANNAMASLLGVGGGSTYSAPTTAAPTQQGTIPPGYQITPGGQIIPQATGRHWGTFYGPNGSLAAANGGTLPAGPMTGGGMVPISSSGGSAGVMVQQPAPTASGGGNAGDAFQNYLNSTGYQFRLGEGQRAITSNAAARGLLNSGAALRANQELGQNLASAEFENYLGQLSRLSGTGLAAGSQISQQGLQGIQAIGSAGSTGGANAAQYNQNGSGSIFGAVIGSVLDDLF